jgi:hypothetical protein
MLFLVGCSLIIMELTDATLKYFERLVSTSAFEMTKFILILSSGNNGEMWQKVIQNQNREEFMDSVNNLYFELDAKLKQSHKQERVVLSYINNNS